MVTKSKVPPVGEREVLPATSRGLRHNVGLRMLKMCRPICPNSRIEMEQDSAGNWRAKGRGPDEMNCQLNGGRWWIACEERGHEPYWTVSRWYTQREILQEIVVDGAKTGEFEVEKVARVPHEVRRPNLAQVAIARNINNGRGPEDAIQRKGFKYLGTLGFEEVCQYRNCMRAVNPKHVIDGLGRYCSQRHLRLVVMVHGQDLGAPAIRLVKPGFHKHAAAKQANLAKKEQAEAMVLAEDLFTPDGDEWA